MRAQTWPEQLQTSDSVRHLVNLCEAPNRPEEAAQWQARLLETEAQVPCWQGAGHILRRQPPYSPCKSYASNQDHRHSRWYEEGP